MKKYLAILIAIAMILSLAACGEKKGPETSKKDPGTTTITPTTAKPAKKDPIKIGMYAPLTGSGAAVGETVKRSVEIAIEQTNDAGGIDGRMLELIIYDDAGTTEGAVKATNRLITMDEVDVIIGDYLSANMLATYPQTEEAKVLQVALGTSASWTNIGCEYLYRATAVATAPITSFVDIAAEVGDKTIAVITTEAEYGQSGRPKIIAGLEGKGITIVSDESYQANETEFSGLVTKVLATNPEGIVIYGVSTELPPLLKQIRQQGYKGHVYTGECGSNSDFLAVVAEAANGLAFAGPYFMAPEPSKGTSEVQVQFLEKFYEKHKEMPYAESAFRAYDAMCLIAEALRNADDPDSGESIKDAFKAIKGFEGIGGIFDYTSGTGEGMDNCNKFMIMDKQVMPFDLAKLNAYYANIQK